MYSHIHSSSARGFAGAPHRLLSRKNRYFLKEISMATVSSHVLDSINGKSAQGIRCQLFQLGDESAAKLVFDVMADDEGRIAESVEIDDFSRGSEFELVFHGRDYFAAQSLAADSMVKTVVIRFVMDDNARRYHLPLMLSAHSYSTWWSG
jgi:5-hydroxyisourate hydrolase